MSRAKLAKPPAIHCPVFQTFFVHHYTFIVIKTSGRREAQRANSRGFKNPRNKNVKEKWRL